MKSLEHLALFIRIVEKKGLASAGREFGLSPTSVTERLTQLETHYGVRLLNRTTRSLSLTEEGQVLFEGGRRLLHQAEDLDAKIRFGMEQISGSLHVSAPYDFGQNKLAPLLNEFLERHPKINLSLNLNDGYVDIIAEGIDVALRFGNLKDSSLHVRKLATNRRILCAAPSYLKEKGLPTHPQDLKKHDCLLMRFGKEIDQEWPFFIEGRPHTLLIQGSRLANTGAVVKDWCLQGKGIALKSIWDIKKELNNGDLVELLEEYAPPPSSVQAIYAGGGAMPKRVRALLDFLIEVFQKDPFKG